jgi:hypothetical protein
MIEQGMKGIVFDAYARADEILRNALPVLADLTIAAFLNVQATRTDVPKPPDLSQVRTFTLQAQNAAPYLPSNQTLLAALGAQFEPIRAYLAGEMQTWRSEVDQASNAGRFTSDPNPGLRLPAPKQQTAYETALGVVADAERNYRLATAAGEPRRLSAATVALATAKADLTRAEQAWRLWQQQNRSTPEVSPQVLPEGGEVLTLSKSALERLLSGLPQKLQSVTARLATATDQRLVQELTAERAHWLALHEAASGLLALVPVGGAYPTIVGTQAEAWARYLGESVTADQVTTFTFEGVGGADTDIPLKAVKLLDRAFPTGDIPDDAVRAAEMLAQSGNTQRQLEAEMLSWKVVSQSPALPLLADVRQDTYAGRLLVVGFTHLWRQHEYSLATWDIAFRLQCLTDIPAPKLVATVVNGDLSQSVADFKKLLREAQYEHLSMSTVSPLVAATDKTTYEWGDTEIRIRFDLPTAGSGIRSAGVYADQQLVSQSGAASFVRLPISSLPSQPFIGPVISTPAYEVYVLHLEVASSTGVRQTINVQVQIATGWVDASKKQQDLEIIPGDYSTLPASDVAHEAEEMILSYLALHAPVRLSEGDWYVAMGSGAHDDNPYHAFYAMDINLPGESDRNHDVLSVAAGTITRLDLTYGTIVIDHPENGSMPNWQSQYLHTPLYESGRYTDDGKKIYIMKDSTGTVVPGLELWEGKHVSADERIAIIGGRGPSNDLHDAGVDEDGHSISDYAFGGHVHFVAMYAGTSRNIVNVVEKAWGMGVSGADAPNHQGFSMTWSTDIATPGSYGAWVNEDFHLVFFRDITVSEDSQTDYWRAWEDGKTPEEMTRVAWDPDSNAWFKWDVVQNTWAVEAGYRQKWSLVDGQFKFSSL